MNEYKINFIYTGNESAPLEEMVWEGQEDF